MKTKFLIVITTMLFGACEELFEKDLQSDSIVILSPSDQLTTNESSITFWWEKVEGTIQYNIQIVQPQFSNIQKLILDTFVEEDKLNYRLLPGQYQWRIRAENTFSTTAYVVQTLTIDSSVGLIGSIVNLISPTNNKGVNSLTVVFNWDVLTQAIDYRFQIGEPDFSSGGNTIDDRVTALDNITYTFLNEGLFQWRVRAQDNTSNSPYTTFNITIDTSKPYPPNLLTPFNGDTLTSTTVLLKWTIDPTSISDTLIIYPDSLISPPLVTAAVIDTFYNFSGVPNEDYFWRVRSIDDAGNSSNYSSLYKFILQ